MKIVVTGATGRLGRDVCAELTGRGVENIGLGSRDCDVRDAGAVMSLVGRERPDAVIHCAAYTKVDSAEDEPELCFGVNADGTRNVAAACRASGARMLYVSTDYVFAGDGENFHRPYDPVGPVCNYGRAKLAGELAVRALLERFFIVRTSWVFGAGENNFVRAMLRQSDSGGAVRVVSDQIGSPTYTADLAPLLCDIAATEKYGVYHATNEGICSWADFAAEIFAMTGRNTPVVRVTTEEYGARAPRPLNSRLSKDGLEEAGFARLPHWRDALERYLRSLQ